MLKAAIVLAALAVSGASQAQTPDWIRQLAKSLLPADLLTENEKTTSPQTVLRKDVEDLFSTIGCTLPEALQKAVGAPGQRVFLPPDLEAALLRQKLNAAQSIKLDGTSLRGLLHTLTIAVDGTTKRNLRLVGARTYRTLDPSTLIDLDSNNLVFTMDCTGYLNAAISSAATLPAAALQGAAKTAQNSSQSIVFARAKVFSPIAIALNPNTAPSGFRLSAHDRLDLLYSVASEAIVAAPNLTDTSNLISWRQQDVVWMSNRGTSALQGSGTMSTSVSAGLGVVSLQGAVDAQIRTAREVRYQAFDTHILSEKESLLPISATYARLRELLTSTIRNVRADERDEIKTGAGSQAIRFFFADIPQRVCELDWRIKTPQPGSAGVSGVRTFWTDSPRPCALYLYLGESQRPSGQLTLEADSGLSLDVGKPSYFELLVQVP